MIRSVAALLLVKVGLVVAQPKVESEKINIQPLISKYYIHLINDLRISDMMVHCKVESEKRLNYWKTTLFWCRMDKPNAYIA